MSGFTTGLIQIINYKLKKKKKKFLKFQKFQKSVKVDHNISLMKQIELINSMFIYPFKRRRTPKTSLKI